MELSIIILFVLLVVFCNGAQSTGANRFLKSKWKDFFKGVDVNHDHVLSVADLKEARCQFSELILDKWWNECITRGNKLTESEFIAAYNKEFTMDKKEFHNRIVQCQELICYDIMDTNKDRTISQEENNILLKVFGHANDVLNAKYFQSFNPVDNLIPAQTLINAWVEFFTNEEKLKENKVKNHLMDQVIKTIN